MCAAAVFLSGCFGGTEIESHAAQRQYDYYVHISSSGSDETAEVNSSKAFRDIQLAYDALICRWAAAGGDSGAELGIIFDSDVTVDTAFMMGIGGRYGRAHDGSDEDVQTGSFQRFNVNTKKLDDVRYNDYRLTVEGQGYSLSPNQEKMWSTFSPYTIMNDKYRSSVMMAANGGHLTIDRLTVDGLGEDLTGLYLYNNTYHPGAGVKKLTASDCTFENLCAQQASQYGAGIGMNTPGTANNLRSDIEISGCTFQNNRMNTGTGTYAGALYMGAGTKCVVRDSIFKDNCANTGGAVAVYKGLMDIDGSNRFSGNEASQRGGTIHDAGTVLLKDLNTSNFQGKGSGQFGGAVTVISNPDFKGRLVLDHCDIRGFTADNAGGGIYVYSGSELFLYGGSSVTGNSNTENVDNRPVSYPSNIHTASSSAKVYAGAVTGETGISTSNPTEHKVLVYSASSGAVTALNDAIRSLSGTQTYEAFSMEQSFGDGDFEKITYDSDVYTLVQDRDVPDNMWLELSAGSYIFWDLNIPGISSPAAEAGNPGEKVNAPEVSASLTSKNVEYLFKGWYTKASGGEKITSGTYPQAGVQVYYAQWDVKSTGGGGTPEPQNKYFTVFFDQNYDGGGITSELVGDTVLTLTVTYDDGTQRTLVCHLLSLGFAFPGDPVREGYDFQGWSLTSDNSTGLVDASYRPQESVTLYAVWKVRQHTLKWDAGEGAPSSTTKRDYGSLIQTPQPPQREGYRFSGWFSDKECTVPLTDGERVLRDAVYYAKWIPVTCLITWDVNYTNGSVTSVYQDYDETLILQEDPVRSGYKFAGWYTGTGGTGTRAENYGTVKENVTFYAYWVHETMDYDVVIQWEDFSDNDGLRPKEVTVALLRNGIETGETYTLTAEDTSKLDKNAWWHTFENLAVSDDISSKYVYSVAVKSSISDEYRYNGDFTSNAYAGYILMSHSLILTDLPVYLRWEDGSDNDGYRPPAVKVVLTADGEPAASADFIYREGKYQPSEVTVAGDEDTWKYVFQKFQKFRTDGDSRGCEIQYGILVQEIQRGDLEEYDISYSGCSAVLTHREDTLSKAVTVSWDDNQNQDNKRPANVVVQLYADKAAVANKYVTLSDGNDWTYTWKDLPKYTDGGDLIHYEAYVVSALVDYTASTSGMSIRLTYVPKSTSISASVAWSDEEDADGLRPEYLLAELYADGEATGDIQTVSENGRWLAEWKNYPYYMDGDRVEYTFRIVNVPEGYSDSYYGIYDTSGLSAVMTHSRILHNLTGNIIWIDNDNQASARPSRVGVQLYTDGKPVSGQSVVLTSEGGWTYIWKDLPVYRDGGIEIDYSMKAVSDLGKYSALSEGMTVQMYYDTVVQDVGCRILWQDDHDADGVRPDYLPVILLIGGERSVYSTVAQSNGTDTWYVEFADFPKYSADGTVIEYGITADVLPSGYTAVHTSGVLILERNAQTITVGGNIMWDSAFDGWSRKPQSAEIALWGYSAELDRYTYLCAATARASDDWDYSFENIPVSDGVTGKKFTGYALGFPQLESYYTDSSLSEKWQHYVAISYDYPKSEKERLSMNVSLRPNAAFEGKNLTDYTVRLSWADNGNSNRSRTYGSVIRLAGKTADSEKQFSYTITEDDISQSSTTTHVFENIPVSDENGNRYVYTAEITGVPENYRVKEHQADADASSFTLVNVRDIPVTAVWSDEKDCDGRRPEEMTLRLYSDEESAGRYIFMEKAVADTVSEAGGKDVWHYVFRGVPVWSSRNTDRELNYRFDVEQTEAEKLDENGYSLDYREYAVSADLYSGGEETYHIFLSRTPETADYAASVLWEDSNDRKGRRPKEVRAQLHADFRDGKGFQPAGKELMIRGTSGQQQWTGVWKDLRVYASGGKKIIYTLLMEDIPHYRAVYSEDSPQVTLIYDENAGAGGSGGESGEGGGSGTGGGDGGSGSGGGNSGGSTGGSGSGSGDGTAGSGGGSTGMGGSGTDSDENSEGGDGDVSSLLNTEDHTAYLQGYPDGTFRADGYMTRAEAAQMFFNLLKDKTADSGVSFTDVKAGDWFYEAAAALSGLGILRGYEDGTFRGGEKITRAEFCSMAVRFAEADENAVCGFSDVPKESWMYLSVASAAEFGWIRGYEDGTFRPQKQVTRGEVCTMANRMLSRNADLSYIKSHGSEIKHFADLGGGHWAYSAVAEAVNSHDYKKTESGEEWIK